MKEVKHKRSDTYNPIYMKHPEQTNPQRQKVDQQLSGARGRDKEEVIGTGYRVSFRGNEHILELDSDNGCTTLEYTKNY